MSKIVKFFIFFWVSLYGLSVAAELTGSPAESGGIVVEIRVSDEMAVRDKEHEVNRRLIEDVRPDLRYQYIGVSSLDSSEKEIRAEIKEKLKTSLFPN